MSKIAGIVQKLILTVFKVFNFRDIYAKILLLMNNAGMGHIVGKVRFI